MECTFSKARNEDNGTITIGIDRVPKGLCCCQGSIVHKECEIEDDVRNRISTD